MKNIGFVSFTVSCLFLVLGCSSTEKLSAGNPTSANSTSPAGSSGERVPAFAQESEPVQIDLTAAVELIKLGVGYTIACDLHANHRDSNLVVDFSQPEFLTKELKTTLFDFEAAMKSVGIRTLTSGTSRYQASYGSLYLEGEKKSKVRIFDFRADLDAVCMGSKDNDGMKISSFESTTRARAIVGPFVSVYTVSTGDSETAVHPWASVNLFTLNSSKIKPSIKNKDTVLAQRANLLELVDNQSLLSSLQNDPFLMKRLGGSLKNTRDLNNLFQLMTKKLNGCDIYVPQTLEDLMGQFAFYDYSHSTGKVSVRLAFDYGCEAMRGNLTQLGLIVEPTATLKELLEQEIATASVQKRSPYFMKYMAN